MSRDSGFVEDDLELLIQVGQYNHVRVRIAHRLSCTRENRAEVEADVWDFIVDKVRQRLDEAFNEHTHGRKLAEIELERRQQTKHVGPSRGRGRGR